ncbi:MAG: hypothetical protein AAB769_00815 [Patescibacteria group bacterium]
MSVSKNSSAEIQEILAKYRNGTMGLDEAADRIWEIDSSPESWWARWGWSIVQSGLFLLGFLAAYLFWK